MGSIEGNLLQRHRLFGQRIDARELAVERRQVDAGVETAPLQTNGKSDQNSSTTCRYGSKLP